MEDKNQPQPAQPASNNLPDLESVLQNARSEATQSSVVAQAPSISQASVATAPTAEKTPESSLSSVPKTPKPWVRWVLIGGGFVLILLLAFLLYRTISKEINTARQESGLSNFGAQEAPLRELSDELGASSLQVTMGSTPQLTVNGRLNVNGRMVIAASARPANPVAGELWYQEDVNRLFFYNGAQYVDMTSSADLANTLQQLRNELRPTVYTAGNGISVDGTTISNAGVVGLASGTPLIQISNSGNGQYVISENFSGALVMLQTDTPGTAQAGNINIGGTMIAANFVGNGSALTDLDATNIATGTLSDARLSSNVTLQGNTFNGPNQLVQLNGANELPAVNGVNLFNLNASNIATGTLSDARLSANVTLMGNTFNGANQLVQLTALGYLPALNGSLVTNLNASNIATGTLSDARLSANVALLNGNQTFTGLNTFSNTVTVDTLTSVGAMTVGNSGQQLALQGDATSTWTANGGGFTTTIGFLGAPVEDVQYYFDRATTNPTSDPVYICTTLGNCAGTGGGVTTLGGTTNQLAKFTGSGSIGNSIISDSGTQVAVSANTNNTATFRVQNASDADLLVADTVNSRVGINQTAASYTLDVNGDINSTTGLRVGGNLVCTSTGCNSSGGSGFYIQNGTATQTAANFNIESAFANQVVGVLRGASGQTADLLQAHNPSGTPVARITAIGNFDTVTGYYINGVQISSANLSNDANLAKLNGTQSFTGANTFTGNFLVQNVANSVGSFQIQNAAGTSNLLIADTQNTRIGIGTATPGYTLDVSGDVNISSGSAYRINGVAICGPTATCAPSSGSTAYIQNGTSLQSSANFNIQSGNAGSVVGILRGAVGQTANLLEVQTGSPTTVFAISSAGRIGVGVAPDSNDVLKVSGNATFLNRVGVGGSVDGNSGYRLQVYGIDDNGILVSNAGNATITLKATSTGGKEWHIASASGGSTNGQGNFAIRTSDSLNPLFVITGAGNVGVGNNLTSPGANLHIRGSDVNTIVQITQGASGQLANLQEWRSSSAKLLAVTPSGVLQFGAAGDVNLYRSAADTLATDDTLTVAGDVVIGANSSLKLTGGSSFPSSPTEGQVFYRTDTDQLYVYNGTRWQADRSSVTYIVAASNSVNKEKADYVADGTDDQVEINAAIAALPSTGGAVVLLDGTFNLTATVNVNKLNTTLQGQGNNTILRRGWNSSAAEGVVNVNATDITVSSFAVDGNKASYNNANNTGVYLVGNVSSGATVTMVTISNTAGFGVHTSGSNERQKIINNSITGATTAGIRLQNTSRNLVSGNRVCSGSSHGVQTSDAGDNIITNNTICSNGGNGVHSADGNSANISSNLIYSNTGIGINANTPGAVIFGNVVKLNASGMAVANVDVVVSENTVNQNTNDGIVLGNSSRVLVQGNTVSSNGRYGIQANNGAVASIIDGNNLYNNTGSTAAASIYVGGGNESNNRIINNRITDTAGTGCAIGIEGAGAVSTYLSGNAFSGTGANCITDNSTTTIYDNQVDASGNIITKFGDPATIQITRGAASQTASLQQWQDSSSNILASMSAAGKLFLQNGTAAGIGFGGIGGNSGIWGGSSTVYIGDNGSARLTVASSGTLVTAAGDSSVVLAVRAYSPTQSGNLQEWRNSADTPLSVISANGSIGAGNSNPGYILHVGSNAISSGATVARFENAGGTCDVTPNVVGGITCTSDERLKKNITNHDDALSKVLGLNVVNYNYLNEADGSSLHVGVLAQDLEQIMPDLVITDANGNKSVSYAGLTPYLAKALQQQQQQIDALQAQAGGSGSSELTGTNLNVSGAATIANLTVTGAANVGSITVVGNATIGGNIKVNGHIVGNADTRGTITIPTGATEVEHTFTTPYDEEPNIILTAKNAFAPSYRVEATSTGFKVFFQTPAAVDTTLNYQAQQ